MSSRMTKYYEEPEISTSRYLKNEDLYKEISKNELNSYNIKSNATILGENKNEIDLEKIKKILDTKYNETPKRRSIRLEEDDVVEEEREITKEYDINVILEKAREQKQDNYEEERLKKLRDTQFDILKNLNLEKNNDVEDLEENNLKTLINTIALNENKNNEDSSPLDILSELKGDGNTEVLKGLKDELNNDNDEIYKTKKVSITDTQMINSFYTSSNALKEKDFEDIEDFSKGLESNNTFIRIIISIIVIIFLIGIVLFIKTIYFK